jgi:NitT/TauT family transport system permease protein
MASAQRVFLGFLMGTLCGVLLGLGIGMSRAFRDMAFPVLEVLRPIPPLAWVPLSILFWPTTELSITFLTFLGSFFTILISAKAGVESIPPNYRLAALSLGADAWAIFWRIVLPASLPSIVTGMAVALGVTWEVVIAAEMIAGHAGLGYMTWDAYMADRLAGIVAGMISIGLAGFLSSAALRALGDRLMPWRKPFR